ncbi:uncharacterized protein [Battus philenor]|uniref:uncharacterized protein n=1 Tax=Battus philenor TaxID=42288 RepID=UPI0035D07D2A
MSNFEDNKHEINIYHSLDNLHIVPSDALPLPTAREKCEIKRSWRISKREMLPLPHEYPSKPAPQQINRREPYPVPHRNVQPDNALVTAELITKFNRKGLNNVINPHQINRTESSSLSSRGLLKYDNDSTHSGEKSTPTVKPKLGYPPIHNFEQTSLKPQPPIPPKKPKNNPVPVIPFKPRILSPAQDNVPDQHEPLYYENDGDEWNYETLAPMPNYNIYQNS